LNYRHAFHAGNFADVLKHVVLARVIAYLHIKPAPIRVMETHAGAGLYDLSGAAAARTGEWREGVGRMETPFSAEVETILAPWRAALASLRAGHGAASYPGSPLFCQELLRSDDRYIGAELHGETSWQLRNALGKDRRFKVLLMDGWHALRANVPPVERRGIVLIDPAFEAADEWERMQGELLAAHRKWPTGCYLVWYPLKNPRQADDLARAVLEAGVHSAIRMDILVDDLAGADRLAGCGLIAINPPWTLMGEAERLLPALAGRLARSARAGYRCERLAG
jgi:23S rRNA (adenine2030-N6)-methyltransferase